MGHRNWANCIRRLAAAGAPVGMAALFGLGCQSTERILNIEPAVTNVGRPAAGPGAAGQSPAEPVAVGTPSPVLVIPPTVLGSANDHIQAAQAIVAPNVLPIPSGVPTDPTTAVPAQGANVIDLGIALRLAGVDNPTINLAREQVQEALADQLGAQSLLLPSVNIGGNYRLHQGPLQTSAGFMRTVDLRSLYAGLGAGVVGTGSPNAPGIRLFAHLGDAFFEPLAAQQRVAVRQSDAQATENAVLLDVIVAYLELVGAEARQAVLLDAQADLDKVVQLTRIYAKEGAGRQGEANRAAANAALVAREQFQVAEDVAVASARLSSLLNLDSGVRLRTPAGPVDLIRLIPEESDIEPLVAAALRGRPELRARSAQVFETQVRVRQEQVRPWVPIISVGYSAGRFAGGSDLVTPDFSPYSGRSDFDVVAAWNFENLFAGNRARAERADAVFGQAVADLNTMTNQVRREVAQAVADARAAARQIETARGALRTAEEGFAQETERIRQGEGRPIELLDSFRQLLYVREEIVRATIAFDIAQFRLFVAVGSNPLAGVGAAWQPEIPARP